MLLLIGYIPTPILPCQPSIPTPVVLLAEPEVDQIVWDQTMILDASPTTPIFCNR